MHKALRTHHAASLLALAGLVLWAGCGATPEPGPAGRREAALVRPMGRSHAQRLLIALRAGLLGALEEGGTARAADFCSREADSLTRAVADRLDPPASLKRVSRHPLDPDNAPDPGDRLALEHFEDGLRHSGKLPEDWVLRQYESGEPSYRYYQPLVAGAPCLPCHGPAETRDPAVRGLWQAEGGVREGDLLGLLRVELAADDLPQPKESR